MRKYYQMLSLLLAVALSSAMPISATEPKTPDIAQEPATIKAEVVQAEPDNEATTIPVTPKTAEAAKSVEPTKTVETVLKTAEPAVKPAETVTTPEPAAKPQAAAATPAPTVKQEPVKELTVCAKCLTPLTEAYRQAHEGIAKWTQEVNAQTSDAEARVQKLQEQIQQNEAAITKLKIEGGKESKARSKELSKDNKQLWSDLKAARKDRASLCQEFARTAAQRVKQYNAEINERLKETQSQMKATE